MTTVALSPLTTDPNAFHCDVAIPSGERSANAGGGIVGLAIKNR